MPFLRTALQWTAAGKGPRFCLYVHHTDAEREWAYDRQSHIGKRHLLAETRRSAAMETTNARAISVTAAIPDLPACPLDNVHPPSDVPIACPA